MSTACCLQGMVAIMVAWVRISYTNCSRSTALSNPNSLTSTSHHQLLLKDRWLQLTPKALLSFATHNGLKHLRQRWQRSLGLFIHWKCPLMSSSLLLPSLFLNEGEYQERKKKKAFLSEQIKEPQNSRLKNLHLTVAPLEELLCYHNKKWF